MREVDLSIVAYRPDFALLQQLLESLAETPREPVRRNLFIRDNSPEPGVAAKIGALPVLAPGGAFARVDVQRSASNVGFGTAHNANAARGSAPLLLLLNQDCIVEPGALDALLDAFEASTPDVAAWEMRQIPYEHPKAYDPVTLETPWVSGAAVMLRRAAFAGVGGFEPRIFMYGEDVDLSWRLRAAGWRLLYQPKAAVVHRTYSEPAEVKPLQALGSVAAALRLRTRYGGWRETLKAYSMLFAEILMPESFPGRRWGLLKSGLAFLPQWPYFAASRVRSSERFSPRFEGWGYERRREGAFVEGRSRRDDARTRPRVSILIRTVDRQAFLRQALASCANQTYDNLEVVVIEDGPERSRAIVEEFADRLTIRYRATGTRGGRARAGNLALAEASGEWLNFLDDDDVFFADHVEVLVDAAMREGKAGAYALAWETHTRFVDRQAARYEELEHVTRHRQRFDRATLWHHNYLPIQAVLFHRRLYERYGGFAEDMDQLEDWNLWTRYTLHDDFVLVEKTTSKYRVPSDLRLAAERQALLDRAYADALARQKKLLAELPPHEADAMAKASPQDHGMVAVTRSGVRRLIASNRVAARVAAYRPLAGRLMRRLGWHK
jgi:GT2 family glycosyltransferase